MNSTDNKILHRLRQMILSGDIPPGKKLSEEPTAEILGVSRTPVRSALVALALEGLLEQKHRRGFHVRDISYAEMLGAIEVRGTLEGLAARQATESGLSATNIRILEKCVEHAFAMFDKGFVTEDNIVGYGEINREFHDCIVEASNNPAIAPALARNQHLPFASSRAVRFDKNDLPNEYKRFYFSNQQHGLVLDAMKRGQGARAEWLMREHAIVSVRYIDKVLPDFTQAMKAKPEEKQ